MPRVVKMGRKFAAASGLPVPFNDCDFERTALALLEAGAIFVSDAGMIGGIIAPAYINSEWLIAVELFWWAEDGQGRSLLSEFENWARANGASEIRMTTLCDIEGPERILARRGYAPCEVSFGKVI